MTRANTCGRTLACGKKQALPGVMARMLLGALRSVKQPGHRRPTLRGSTRRGCAKRADSRGQSRRQSPGLGRQKRGHYHPRGVNFRSCEMSEL